MEKQKNFCIWGCDKESYKLVQIIYKARYENEMLKPLEKLELEEGEEVEIEVKKASVEEFHGKMRIDKEIADEIIEMEIWD